MERREGMARRVPGAGEALLVGIVLPLVSVAAMFGGLFMAVTTKDGAGATVMWVIVAFAGYGVGMYVKGHGGGVSEPTEAELAERQERLEEARERLEERSVEKAMNKRDKALRKAGLKCPRCGSEDVALVGDTGRPLSAGKALVGGAVGGPAGAAVGAMLGKRGRREYVCLSCGHRYRAK